MPTATLKDQINTEMEKLKEFIESAVAKKNSLNLQTALDMYHLFKDHAENISESEQSNFLSQIKIINSQVRHFTQEPEVQPLTAKNSSATNNEMSKEDKHALAAVAVVAAVGLLAIGIICWPLALTIVATTVGAGAIKAADEILTDKMKESSSHVKAQNNIKEGLKETKESARKNNEIPLRSMPEGKESPSPLRK